MSDFTLEPQNTLAVGMQRSGKTSFALRLLLNSNSACNFIFDEDSQCAGRLRLRPCHTLNECEAALAGRWVAFNPERMFPPAPGDKSIVAPKLRAFRWFCAWVYEVIQRGPGRKLVSLPEIWQFCTPDSIPPEFATLCQKGAKFGVHLILDTQRPELINESVVGASTELICFKLISPDALRTVERLGADRAAVAALPLGSFISYDRLRGGTLAGRVF